ncbi:MAG: F0F1 ATP synthase subunit A [Candidatus Zixiibacteriota bacterium]
MSSLKQQLHTTVLVFLAVIALGGLAFAQDHESTTDPDTATTSGSHSPTGVVPDNSAVAGAHAETHAEEHEAGGHEEEGHELPNFLGLIFGHKANPKVTDIQYWENVIFALLAGLILVFFARRIYVRRTLIPGKLQNAVEMLVQYFYDFFYAILGKNTKKYMPFLGTLFVYILTMNFMGMIPFFKAASASINITVSLALLTFVYAQYVGFKEMGVVGWLDHLAGEPRDVVGWVLVPMLFPIHIIGELAKPFSLAVRLFGNITGEDVLIFAFVMLGLSIGAAVGSPVGAPLQAIFMPLTILFSAIQALVFTALSTIYIALMIPHPEHS